MSTETPTKHALFYSNIQPINKKAHKDAGLKDIGHRFTYAAKAHVVPVVLRELASTAISYPIIFVGEERSPAAALGLIDGQNLFVDSDGAWDDDFYIPTAIRRYPFLMAAGPEEKSKFLCIDEDAELFTANSSEHRFFEDDKPSKMLESAMRECERFDYDINHSNDALKVFQEFDLYCTKTLTFRDKSGEENKIQFTAVDENRLQELDKDALSILKEKGLLDLIYAHLVSLANWNRLVRRYNLT